MSAGWNYYPKKMVNVRLVGKNIKNMWKFFIYLHVQFSSINNTSWLICNSVDNINRFMRNSLNTNSFTYTPVFRILEWSLATPFTAWEPTIAKWAMLIHFSGSSSTIDNFLNLSILPGYFSSTLCKRNENYFTFSESFQLRKLGFNSCFNGKGTMQTYFQV